MDKENYEIIYKNYNKLLKENEELKARVSSLEKELKNTNKALDDTKDELAIIRKDLDTFKNNKLFQKIIVGLQDLNSWELLEKKVSQPKILMRLRQNRISECHYIDNYYDPNEKEIRRNILIDKINENTWIQNKLNTIYPDLLNTLKPFLQKREVVVDDELINFANNWWDF